MSTNIQDQPVAGLNRQLHSALSQVAELLDNMPDDAAITDAPRYLAEKLGPVEVDDEGMPYGAAPIQSAELAELKRLAEAATPGPWFASDWNEDDGVNAVTVEIRSPEVLCAGQSSIWPGGVCKTRVAETEFGDNPLADAAFIAAANPATILRLLDALAAVPAAPIQSAELRADLEAIDRAMQHMGDALNSMDACDEADENVATPGFEAIARLLAAVPAAQQQPDLNSFEQYRMQMAGISTAALGYCKADEPVLPEYQTPALADVQALYAKYAALHAAQQQAQSVTGSFEFRFRDERIAFDGDVWTLPATYKRLTGLAMHLAKLLAAVSAAQQQAQSVPAGWKLVPVEPTPDMLDVAGEAMAKGGAEGNVLELQGDAHTAYSAMLAAAPVAPHQESAE